ncbi:hypothetical protein CDL15_Pgr016696 [Punica granatum]|uniref:Uncharacterized protein n=1 Tax=Punica granatum TaxID=22663 RepID=A0A218XT42_PUNGR|nr:hypothetical protein CDL15_Pgr016696 [Punica granatum]
MVAICFYGEFLLPVPPDQLFRAAVTKGHYLTPKLLPHAIKSMDFIVGDGGPGVIKRTILTIGWYHEHHVVV